MIAQISYVASRDEVERLLDTAPEERDEAWQAFWDSRDPDPSTTENEFRTEFLRRLGYVNTRFRSVVEGWQTDMGRIYIQYGEPDDVDSQPIGRMLHAWETWYYYSEHQKFVFVDRDGFGEFRLIESSRI
jgi:GWxTD domain-containing protein